MPEHPMMPDMGDYDPSLRGFMRSLGRAILGDIVSVGIGIRSEIARERASLLGELIVEAEAARDQAVDALLAHAPPDIPSTVPTEWVKKYY